MNDLERCAWETMRAWQEARDACERGSKQWEECDKEFKKAQLEYYKVKE